MIRAENAGKAAVMPKCPADGITVLDATQEMHGRYADRLSAVLSILHQALPPRS